MVIIPPFFPLTLTFILSLEKGEEMEKRNYLSSLSSLRRALHLNPLSSLSRGLG